MYSLGQGCLLQVLLSSEFPPQVLPNRHFLLRVSEPVPHVTEQVQLDQDDQATKMFSSDKVVNHVVYLCDIFSWFMFVNIDTSNSLLNCVSNM